jgi:chitosanase
MVTLIAGDTGHLTYGRSQTTLGSGNLHDLLQRYCANPGARFRKNLESYLTRFSQRDISLDDDTTLHNILRACADDPVMRDTQDAFFDDVYWRAAARTADRHGISMPLGLAVVYDSFVHGSWKRISEPHLATVRPRRRHRRAGLDHPLCGYPPGMAGHALQV